MTESEIPSYEDVLRQLSEKAANGSVSAMVCLERALRPENLPRDPDEKLDEALDQILRKAE